MKVFGSVDGIKLGERREPALDYGCDVEGDVDGSDELGVSKADADPDRSLDMTSAIEKPTWSAIVSPRSRSNVATSSTSSSTSARTTPDGMTI